MASRNRELFDIILSNVGITYGVRSLIDEELLRLVETNPHDIQMQKLR